MRLNRLNDMETYIAQKGTVSLEELSAAFQISEITVRRDLSELEKRGGIQKVYGGAAAVRADAPVPSEMRAQIHRKEKEWIGALAASLVGDNETVFIDSGSTTACIIPHLASKQNITIVTHSLSALTEAAKFKGLNVVSIGGFFSRATASFVGGSAQTALSEMNIRTAFMGATGVSIENGLSNSTLFEAEIKKCAVAHSSRIILTADHHKFGQNALLTFCPLSRLDAVVTDRPPEAPYTAFFEQHQILLACK